MEDMHSRKPITRQYWTAIVAAYNRRYSARRAVLGLLAIHTILLLFNSVSFSPTLNEPAHLVAGISHWEFARFELYRVNPPLVRSIAALPVLLVGYEHDWSGWYERPGARPVFGLGEDFVAANGERSLFLITIARCACIPLSWIGAVTCYVWARDLYGRTSGVVACALWSFDPTILGHSSLITPDAHAAGLSLAACYVFWRWLKKATWSLALAAGVVLGIAELTKTTLLVLFILWPLLWMMYRWPERLSLSAREWARQTGMLTMQMFVGIYILNLGYGLEGSMTRLGDYRFVSKWLSGNDGSLRQAPSETVDYQLSGNRFSSSWMGNLPVPVPKNYLAGIDIQQADFENEAKRSYLAGQWRNHGWWYFYLYATLVKAPLGTLLLGVLTFFTAITCRPARAPWREQAVLLAPAILVFGIVSAKTGFTEHMRYVLPAFPFFFVWVSQSFAMLGPEKTQWRRVIAVLLLTWAIGSSLLQYPHSLSYFNELARGPVGGPRHLLSSNIDWGQDLRYLKSWIESQKSRHDLYLAYFGSTNPEDLGIHFVDVPPEIRSSHNLRNLSPGWYAVSVNFLWGYERVAHAGARRKTFIDRDEFSGLRSLTPSARVGSSIYVYKIDAN